jgi:hypothetical protein
MPQYKSIIPENVGCFNTGKLRRQFSQITATDGTHPGAQHDVIIIGDLKKGSSILLSTSNIRLSRAATTGIVSIGFGKKHPQNMGEYINPVAGGIGTALNLNVPENATYIPFHTLTLGEYAYRPLPYDCYLLLTVTTALAAGHANGDTLSFDIVYT